MEIAKKRWKLLAKAIINNAEDEEPYGCSVKLDGAFGVVMSEPVFHEQQSEDERYQWFRYTFTFHPQASIFLRHTLKRFTADELTGFDNTGNVCVWPSEEVLGHYCLSNANIFKGKQVIELGGGMTCLAGLAISKFVQCSTVCLTDGNQNCVTNVEVSTLENLPPKTSTTVRRLDWKDPSSYKNFLGKWDIVLCADCAFFDDGRESLVNTIWSILVPKGIALIMAPKRGETLQKFLDLCQGRFTVTLSEDYDSDVTKLHEKKCLEHPGYKPDIHYPLLATLSKI